MRNVTVAVRRLAFLVLAFGLPFAAGAAPSASTTPATKKALPFHEDDYARALSEARAKKLPLFIEAWAPW